MKFILAFALLVSYSELSHAVWADLGAFNCEGCTQIPEQFEVAPNGDIFVSSAEFGPNDDSAAWVVLRKRPNELSFSKVDAFELTPGGSGWANNVFFWNDKVYVTGLAQGENKNYFSTLRMSEDSGDTWKTVEAFQLESPSTFEVFQAAAPTQKAIFIGTRSYSSDKNKGVIRRSTDGTHFITVDVYQHNGSATEVWGMAAIDDENVIASYSFSKSDGKLGIVLRATTDGGATWNTVSEIAPEGTGTFGFKMRSTNEGLFIAGDMTEETLSYATIWKSTDKGLTWIVSDKFRLENAAGGARANDLTTDNLGALWTAGSARDANNVPHCFVRRSEDGGATWTTDHTYLGQDALGARCYSIRKDVDDSLLVVGRRRLSSGGDEAFVRKLQE